MNDTNSASHLLPERLYDVHVNTDSPQKVYDWLVENINSDDVFGVFAYTLEADQYLMTIKLKDETAATLVRVMWGSKRDA